MHSDYEVDRHQSWLGQAKHEYLKLKIIIDRLENDSKDWKGLERIKMMQKLIWKTGDS